MISHKYVIILLINYIIKIWSERNRHIWGLLIQIEVEIIHSKKIIYKNVKTLNEIKLNHFENL